MSSKISERYRDLIIQMVKNSSQSATVTGANTFQPGNLTNRPYIEKMLADQMLPQSRIEGLENLLDLHRRCEQGASCLILMEHYSNFDLPAFVYLLERSGAEGRAAADSIIAIAGLKLNAESDMVLSFTEAYSRIVIYPSRYFDSITDPEVLKAERAKSNAINRAALHEMVRCKHEGHIILVFPAGTRYRPDKPDTKRGLKEIDSYVKAFDYMVFIGSGGNLLRINPNGDMSEDILAEDTVIFKIGPVVGCQEFRSHAREAAAEGSDAKRFTVDRVMEELEKLHKEIEAIREPKTL
ncbi:MAG: 1-acyl-sn-glycerol-3-phosphate acyltransferase [Spirochaetales bacterium]|nr:1-acyl-sn-glycerol-3-phosphate acyltransferase [Spirochaetales bacterium]